MQEEGRMRLLFFTSRLIFQTRKQIAELFHMKDGEQSLGAERVVFTMNATESLNIVLKGLLHPGDHVITTEMEHNSVLRPLYELEEKASVSQSFSVRKMEQFPVKK